MSMRVTGGKCKGRSVIAPKGLATRPSSAQTRQMVFDVLIHARWSPAVADAGVIDLYAGSGALGIEALSRRAAHCLFVDSGKEAISVIQTNLNRLGLADNAEVRLCRAEGIGRRPDHVDPADLAFVDPPYRSDPDAALAALIAGRWLDPQAVVIVETGRERNWSASLRIIDSRRCGAAHVSFLSAG